MKIVWTALITIFVSVNLISFESIAQQSPIEVSEEIMKKIESNVLLESIEFEKTIDTNSFSKSYIHFMLDTFKVERISHGMLDYDYSTYGINQAIDKLIKGYDQLLNKYYKILYQKLKAGDQEILKESQRNWLQYRDSELKLLAVLIKEEYSGGGSIQTNLLGSRYAEKIIHRVVEIYEMYDSIIAD